MPTTGTTAFALDFTDIAEEAWEQAGKEMRTGYQLETAKRSMNLLLIEWQNRGINLWTVDTGEVPLLTGVAEYTLPADTVDIMDQIIRTGTGTQQSDINCNRVSSSVYATIPNKNILGRPLQVWVRRLRDAPQIVVWPLPESDDYTFVYWRMRRMEDAGDGVETPDINYRFYPALVAGLAYMLAKKDPDLAPNAPNLQQEYERQFNHAAGQDREKATLRITPRISRV